MLANEIRYFLSVANHGSLTAASEELFVAPSAISRQIHKLEERIGVPLFERHARGMSLNEAGKRLENYVRKNLHDSQLLINELKGMKPAAHTLLKVGCTEGTAFSLMPCLLSQFQRDFPDVNFLLKIGSAFELNQWLRNGEVDVALQFTFAPERGVEVIDSFPAPLCLVMSQDHPLADKLIQLTDLKAFPLALPDKTTTIRQLFDMACQLEGIYLEPSLNCNNLASLFHFMLNRFQAVTICSHFSLFAVKSDKGFILRKVNIEQLNQRQLQIHTLGHKHRSTGLQQFLAFCRHQLSEISEWDN